MRTLRITRFFFLMIVAAVFLEGKSFARQSSSLSQQAPSQSREKPASDPSEGNRDGQLRAKKDGAGGGRIDGGPNGSEHAKKRVPQQRPARNQAKQVPSHEMRSVSTGNQVRPGDRMDFPQTGSTTSTVVPNRAVNHRNLPVPPPRAGLNGRQFNRDRGARLATSGGPPLVEKGTAEINGTNLKPKL